MECAGDLRWAATGPFLWGSPPPLYDQWLGASESLWPELADHPQELLETCAPHRHTPIGRYFETLFGYWLSKLPEAQNVHQNVTIAGSAGTLGELDLVFQSHGVAYHWELALKFYIGVGDLADASSWHGPRGRDRLDKKLAKLVDKQLCLPQKPLARAHLETLGMRDISSHAVVKGYLFYPWEQWTSITTRPEGVPETHDRGWWLPLARLDEALSMPAAGWHVLQKADWLGPCSGVEVMSVARVREELVEQVSRYGSTMLAALHPDGREQSRGFVVPDAWGPIS